MIRFSHIAPTSLIDRYTSYNGVHLLLAHLVEQDPVYRNYYAKLNDGKPKILDNSAFELYKQGKPMFDPNKLIELGKKVKADYLVLSDYPGVASFETIKMAEKQIPKFKKAGFKTFFVPQSRVGDYSDYFACMLYAVNNPNIDLIGLSILGVPNAYGVEKDNRLQRYLARYAFMNDLLPYLTSKDHDRFHCLGMVDGPNEISMLRRDFDRFIFSWDSSSAIWAGIHGIIYDKTPTGLREGKLEREVDFSLKVPLDVLFIEGGHERIMHNITYINRLAGY